MKKQSILELIIYRSAALLLLLLTNGPVWAAAFNYDPPALYLTWQRDPTTTMTVHWHTAGPAKSELFFRERGTTIWVSCTGSEAPLPTTKWTVHTVEITGLKPDTVYDFCFWPGAKVFTFETAPADLRKPLRFVTGGDVYHQRDWMDNMNELAAKLDPEFVVIGGDLAYSCDGGGRPENMARWEPFFESWKEKARGANGRLIPMLVTIGNHETVGFWNQPVETAVGFYGLFAMPGLQSYACLDFGNYFSLLLLDSGHTRPVAGPQTRWLAETLHKRRNRPHVIPIYHVTAYPSVRVEESGESGKITQSIREHWCPLFEKNNVGLAFENHDHAYKRTHPMRQGKADPKGVVYLGDGAWGVGLRTPQPRSYIARSGAIRHLWQVTLYPEGRHVFAVNEKGELFDEVFQAR